MATTASANMPPKEFDSANNRMSISQIKRTAHDSTIHYVLVRNGESNAICGGGRYGCFIPSTNTIVYSYDPSGKDQVMDKNTLRHEIGHKRGWPSDHPHALP